MDWMDFNNDGEVDATESFLGEEMLCSSRDEYSDAKVHPFRKFRAPFSGKAEHTFPE